jgi:hypothetical protein
VGRGGQKVVTKGGWTLSKYLIYLKENRIIKPIIVILKGKRGIRKSNWGGGFDQSTLYAFMVMPQW